MSTDYTFPEGSILAEYIVQGDYKLSMWIPSDLAGRVVGKKGVVITNLQRETRVKQMNALSPVGDSLWIAVVIIGDWKGVTAAYKAVSDIVFGEVDDIVLEFSINHRKPCFFYKKGREQFLKIVSAKTNVRIFLPDNPKESSGFPHTQPMTLEGSFENVQKAVVLFEIEALEQKEKDRLEIRSDIIESKQPKIIRREDTVKLKGEEAPHELRKEDTRLIVPPPPPQLPLPDSPTHTHGTEDKLTEQKGECKVECTDSNKSESRFSRNEKKLEKRIDIPLNLVGLLLSRKPQLKISILNQIQGMTSTIISKILPSSDRKPVTDEDNNNGNHDQTQEELQNKLPSEVNEPEFVPFKIVGYNEANIEMAYDHLQKIIQGERIKDVIEMLKISTAPRASFLKDKTQYKPRSKKMDTHLQSDVRR